MFYILTKKIGCVPYFFQLIVSEERGDRMFTDDSYQVLAIDNKEGIKTDEIRNWGAEVVIGSVTDNEVNLAI